MKSNTIGELEPTDKNSNGRSGKKISVNAVTSSMNISIEVRSIKIYPTNTLVDVSLGA